MKRIILNIDDNYSDVITVTAVGVRGNITTRVLKMPEQ